MKLTLASIFGSSKNPSGRPSFESALLGRRISAEWVYSHHGYLCIVIPQVKPGEDHSKLLQASDPPSYTRYSICCCFLSISVSIGWVVVNVTQIKAESGNDISMGPRGSH